MIFRQLRARHARRRFERDHGLAPHSLDPLTDAERLADIDVRLAELERDNVVPRSRFSAPFEPLDPPDD